MKSYGPGERDLFHKALPAIIEELATWPQGSSSCLSSTSLRRATYQPAEVTAMLTTAAAPLVPVRRRGPEGFDRRRPATYWGRAGRMVDVHPP